jgi:hypothetical protein
VLPLALAMTSDGAAAEAVEKVLFLRVLPTDASWGEISLSQGSAVEASTPKDSATYPFSAKLACVERERKERAEAMGSAARLAPSPARPCGTLYFVAQLEEGREVWQAFLEQLLERVGPLTPKTFGAFARGFDELLEPTMRPIAKQSFRVLACASVEEQKDEAWEIEKRVEDGNIFLRATGFPDPRPICATLARALEGEPPAELLSTRFDVRAVREESLLYFSWKNRNAPPAAWPDGAGIEYGTPPSERTTSYRKSGGGGGWVYYEELRKGRHGGPPGTEKPYILKARARDAAVAEEALDADALLTRWSWRIRETTLGTSPKTTAEETEILDVAFFFTAPHGPPKEDSYTTNVAEAFASSAETPGLSLLENKLLEHMDKFGTDAMFAVLCEHARPKEAKLCVAAACNRLLNAEAFCNALASRLDSIDSP